MDFFTFDSVDSPHSTYSASLAGLAALLRNNPTYEPRHGAMLCELLLGERAVSWLATRPCPLLDLRSAIELCGEKLPGWRFELGDILPGAPRQRGVSCPRAALIPPHTTEGTHVTVLGNRPLPVLLCAALLHALRLDGNPVAPIAFSASFSPPETNHAY